MNDAIENLTDHPAILAFVEAVTKRYDLTSEPEEVGAVVVVRPMNPPYRSVRYVHPFVQDLEEDLEESGFKCTDHHNYEFEGHGLRAWIDNVDVSDPEEADPIEVCFTDT